MTAPLFKIAGERSPRTLSQLTGRLRPYREWAAKAKPGEGVQLFWGGKVLPEVVCVEVREVTDVSEKCGKCIKPWLCNERGQCMDEARSAPAPNREVTSHV